MGTGKFQANPPGLEEAADRIAGLPGMAMKIGDDFVAHQTEYQDAYGTSDEFYLQNYPKFEESNDALLEFIRGVSDACSALGSATLGTLMHIKGTQQDAEDLIQQQFSRLDAGETGGGGGKH